MQNDIKKVLGKTKTDLYYIDADGQICFKGI